jgi:hypothetical protein
MPFGDVAAPAQKTVTYIAMPRRAIGEKSGDEALSPPKVAAVGI